MKRRSLRSQTFLPSGTHWETTQRMLNTSTVTVLRPLSFSEDSCTKRQRPTALQQRKGLDPSVNDWRLPASSRQSSPLQTGQVKDCFTFKPAGRLTTASRPKLTFSYCLESSRYAPLTGHSARNACERQLSDSANTCSRPSTEIQLPAGRWRLCYRDQPFQRRKQADAARDHLYNEAWAAGADLQNQHERVMRRFALNAVAGCWAVQAGACSGEEFNASLLERPGLLAQHRAFLVTGGTGRTVRNDVGTHSSRTRPCPAQLLDRQMLAFRHA